MTAPFPSPSLHFSISDSGFSVLTPDPLLLEFKTNIAALSLVRQVGRRRVSDMSSDKPCYDVKVYGDVSVSQGTARFP